MLWGGKPKTARGNKYILIFEDLFTRWIECIPIERTNAKTILQHLREQVFLRYGAPEVFLSDNGREFKNKAIDQYLREQSVRHELTPPYHPQANPVERVNRTINNMVHALIEENHNTWDERLSDIAFRYNTVPHSSTGVSPAILMYGTQPRKPSAAKQDAAAEKELQQRAIDA
ncbi:uncharacterized protein K02A2.6-like [Nasonia vitripennis]|uniref:Integrase catalytic domain-containing protein n=1 Tax=Nasonia vitripennis TaxID=7425 RepID=A0A7M7IT28_NASVI|nr:uncharacterized protein K02A2.6-like [Nasonia vitripennis]